MTMVAPMSGTTLDVSQFINGSLGQTTQQINGFLANPGSSEAPAEQEQEAGGGLISGLTQGIPLVGGMTDGLHKVVSSVPVVGDLLGGIF